MWHKTHGQKSHDLGFFRNYFDNLKKCILTLFKHSSFDPFIIIIKKLPQIDIEQKEQTEWVGLCWTKKNKKRFDSIPFHKVYKLNIFDTENTVAFPN